MRTYYSLFKSSLLYQVISFLFVGSLVIQPRLAWAQDQAKNDLTHAGEFRLRETWDINPRGGNHLKPNSNSVFAEHFRVELGFRAGEKLSATLTALNNFNWGGTLGDEVNVPSGRAGGADYLTVNQAYANWMIADELRLKVGRINYQIGDGALISVSDYEPIAYGFDGALGEYEGSFARFEAFAFKFREFGNASDATPTAGQPSASDAERNVYGLNFILKTRPEWLGELNAHILRDWADGLVDDQDNPGRDVTRFGALAGFEYRIFDAKLWYEGLTGRYHFLNSATAQGDVTTEGTMAQIEVGAKIRRVWNGRLFAKYHFDSGTKDSDAINGKQGLYDPFFYEGHCGAGCMDILSWGNLTALEFGFTIHPSETAEIGVSYWTFKKSEHAASVDTPAPTPASDPMMGSDGYLGAGSSPDRSNLGQEFDLWAERHYGENIELTARIGEFIPGDVYRANGGIQHNPITQFFAQARFTF